MPSFQVVVFLKESGEIVSVFKEQKASVDLLKLGPEHGAIKVVSSKPIDLVSWKVEQGQLVRRPVYFRVEKPADAKYHVVCLGDKSEEATGFGAQVGLLGTALKERNFTVEYHKYTEVGERFNWQYNVLLSLSDLAQISALLENPPVNWVHWLPISSKSISPLFWERLLKVPFIVAMSKFGYDEILAHGYPSNRLSLVPHGVDTKIYRPMMSLERKAVRMSAGVDSFYVLCFVGTNIARKRLDLLLDVYEGAVKAVGKGKLILLLKTWEKGAIDVRREISRRGLEDEIRLQPEDLSPADMAIFYSMCDLYVSTAEAEGFGVPIIEALACGLPVITGDHTTSGELIAKFGQLIPCGVEHKTLYDYKIDRYPPKVPEFIEAIKAHFELHQVGVAPDRSAIRSYIVRNFSRELVVSSWEEVLHKILDSTGESMKAVLREDIFPKDYEPVETLATEVGLVKV